MNNQQLDVRYVANLARLDLSDQEVSEFQTQLNRVLEHVEQISSLDLTAVEPTAHAHPVFDVYRADEPRAGLQKQAALDNAPAQANGLFLITKVIE